jgi:hypothetical protein
MESGRRGSEELEFFSTVDLVVREHRLVEQRESSPVRSAGQQRGNTFAHGNDRKCGPVHLESDFPRSDNRSSLPGRFA